MSPLIRKEVRMLLPVWLAAMILAIAPAWLFWRENGDLLFTLGGSFTTSPPNAIVHALFWLGACLLALESFGQEVSVGTFANLLVQPVDRRRLWMVKTIILAVALCLAYAAFNVSMNLRASFVSDGLTAISVSPHLSPETQTQLARIAAEARAALPRDSLLMSALWVCAAFGGGLWTILLVRQVAPALWITLLFPPALLYIAGGLWEAISPESPLWSRWGAAALLGCYSIAGFLWARRLFLRAQDVQWTGGILALPVWRVVGGTAESTVAGRKRKPFRALVGKELQLQHVNLILAASLLVLHLGVLLFRKTNQHYLVTHRSVEMVLEFISLVWWALPFLIGGAAVADERRMGTLEGFLCLPVKRRREFAIKAGIALLFGAFLGGVMPLLMDRIGWGMGLSSSGILPKEFWLRQGTALIIIVAALLAGGITLLSLYASTLTRNLLQALGLAVALLVLALFTASAVAALGAGQFALAPLWRGPLVGLVMWPWMAVTILLLSFGNFKHSQINVRVWLRNISCVLCSLVAGALVTTLVYNRAWEIWTPVEPVHRFRSMTGPFGEVHLNGQLGIHVAKMESSVSLIAVITEHGWLWLRQGHFSLVARERNGHTLRGPRGTGPWQTGFFPVETWRDVAVSARTCLAIQSDGSLWDLSGVEFKDGTVSGGTRLGEDRDWKSVSIDGDSILALKANGTIWEWGDRVVMSGTNAHWEKISVPVQTGTNRDWVAACEFGGRKIAVKPDGTIWKWGLTYNRDAPITEQPELWIRGPAKAPVLISFNSLTVALVCEDGSLWIGGVGAYGQTPQEFDSGIRQMMRWENDTNWSVVKLLAMGAVGLKQDGSLWQLNWVTDRASAAVAVPSAYSDWIALSPCWRPDETFFALAADGTLCEWTPQHQHLLLAEVAGRDILFEHNSENHLLAPSRIKARKIADLSRAR